MINKKSILVICAHPDDEIIGCGGTIAKYSQGGRNVITIILSYGEGSHPWLIENKIKNIRIKESLNAGKTVGTNETIFLGVTDSAFKIEMKKKPIIIKTLQELIEKYSPEMILTHSYDDVMYYDHKATYLAVIKAARLAKYPGEIYTFNIWNPMIFRKRNRPKLVVDITDTFNKKIIALGAFKSQKLALLQLGPVVYIRAVLTGLNKGFKFAEIFYKIK